MSVNDSACWNVKPFSWAAAEEISRELGVPLLVGTVLARRGFGGADAARSFLSAEQEIPSPFACHGVRAAVKRVARAISASERVVIHGDYDVDGISASALVTLGLRHFGIDATCLLPDRCGHGYGLSEGAVREMAQGGSGLLITVDCGVNYPDEVALARSLGLEVIVTDHHRPGDVLPACTVVHPQLGGYPGSELCGVGVALKMLHGLHVELCGAEEDRLPDALVNHLDLVALGTIADIVPLVGENRYYVAEGLRRIAVASRPGLRALLEVAKCAPHLVNSNTVAFRLAPRLNAPGRLANPDLPLRLLLTEDSAEAEGMAAQLDSLNRQRQEVEASILQQALQMVEETDPLPPLLVLAGEGWHEGVIGIVASRLVDRLHRPVIMLALSGDRAKGSGRSIPAYDLVDGLRSCSGLLDVYGGHCQAAGLTLRRAMVDGFRRHMTEHAAARLTARDLLPSVAPDAIVSGPELTLDTVDALSRLAPFGAGNPPVKLLALGADLDNVGCTRNGNHLRCTLVLDGVRTRGIGFGLAPEASGLRAEHGGVHAELKLEAGEWNGLVRPEVMLAGFYRSPDMGESALGCSPDCPYLDSLEATPPCSICRDPLQLAQRECGPGLPGRDMRDQGVLYSTLAQVVSSGEPVGVIGVSVPHRLRQVASRVPLRDLGVTGVDCVSRLCWRTRLPELRPEAVLFLDWTAAVRRAPLLESRRHLLVIDPPFNQAHVAMLHHFESGYGVVHLCYGDEERRFTEKYLQLTEHPRTWMVPLYRALRAGMDRSQAFHRVSTALLESHGVLASADDLLHAWGILSDMGLTSAGGEVTSIDADDVPRYASAVASYREAVNLCRTL